MEYASIWTQVYLAPKPGILILEYAGSDWDSSDS